MPRSRLLILPPIPLAFLYPLYHLISYLTRYRGPVLCGSILLGLLLVPLTLLLLLSIQLDSIECFGEFRAS